MRILSAALFLALTAFAGNGQPPKEDKKEPETIVINDQLTTLDPRDFVTNNHQKVHVLKLQADQTYLITMLRKDDKQPFNPYLRIEDSTGKQLQANGGNLKVRLKFTPGKNDTYRLIATSNGGVGEYVLKIAPSVAIKVLKDHDPAKLIDIGKGGFELTARITDKDKRDTARQQMFAKIYHVKMVKDKVYSIDMIASPAFDAFLRLEDAEGKQLAADDDSGGNLNALIVFRAPETGTYKIITTTFAPNAQGEFLLRVEEQ
jgi:hypothetical protein